MKMKRFDLAFNKALHSFKLRDESWLRNPGRCKHEWFKLRDESVVTEMNTKVWPVPKDLLSELVDECYRNGWCLAKEYPFTQVIKLVKSSENSSFCDMEKLERKRMDELLLVCLPSSIGVWKEKLKIFFNDEDIISLHNAVGSKKGASGTYSRGELVVLNADFISSLSDCAEILEHELIHMLKDINEQEQSCSPQMQFILGSTRETDTWTSNLANALLTMYDHKMAMLSGAKDTEEARKQFLDEVFSLAEKCQDFETFHNLMKKYETSALQEDSLLFLWRLLRWEPEELPGIRKKIYAEFSSER